MIKSSRRLKNLFEAGRRLYTSNADPRFQRMRRLMEDEWTAQLTSLLDISRRDLPIIWDADFMLGPPGDDGTESYVLGEINVSSVFPIPEEASGEISRRVAERLSAHKLQLLPGHFGAYAGDLEKIA